jgi:hypothetical protein
MLVISIGLFSGCIETTNNDDLTDDTEQVEIVTYKIETFGAEIGERPGKIGDGFIYNETAKNGYYQITGKIKNIAGRTLNNITIKVDLFDKNHTYLGSENTEPEDIFDLPLQDKETADFKINIIYLYTESYFFEIDDIKINVLVGSDETTDNGDSNGETDEIELISYTIETFGGEYGLKPEKIGEGFIHNEHAKNGYYQIKGTIKNIAGKTLKNITVKVELFDINHTYLGSEYSKPKNIFDLPLLDNETATFKINIIYLYLPSYFLQVEEIEFYITGKY